MPAGPSERIKTKESKRQVIRSKLGSDDEEDDDNEVVPSLKRECFQLDRKIPEVAVAEADDTMAHDAQSFPQEADFLLREDDTQPLDAAEAAWDDLKRAEQEHDASLKVALMEPPKDPEADRNGNHKEGKEGEQEEAWEDRQLENNRSRPQDEPLQGINSTQGQAKEEIPATDDDPTPPENELVRDPLVEASFLETRPVLDPSVVKAESTTSHQPLELQAECEIPSHEMRDPVVETDIQLEDESEVAVKEVDIVAQPVIKPDSIELQSDPDPEMKVSIEPQTKGNREDIEPNPESDTQSKETRPELQVEAQAESRSEVAEPGIGLEDEASAESKFETSTGSQPEITTFKPEPAVVVEAYQGSEPEVIQLEPELQPKTTEQEVQSEINTTADLQGEGNLFDKNTDERKAEEVCLETEEDISSRLEAVIDEKGQPVLFATAEVDTFSLEPEEAHVQAEATGDEAKLLLSDGEIKTQLGSEEVAPAQDEEAKSAAEGDLDPVVTTDVQETTSAVSLEELEPKSVAMAQNEPGPGVLATLESQADAAAVIVDEAKADTPELQPEAGLTAENELKAEILAILESQREAVEPAEVLTSPESQAGQVELIKAELESEVSASSERQQEAEALVEIKSESEVLASSERQLEGEEPVEVQLESEVLATTEIPQIDVEALSHQEALIDNDSHEEIKPIEAEIIANEAEIVAPVCVESQPEAKDPVGEPEQEVENPAELEVVDSRGIETKTVQTEKLIENEPQSEVDNHPEAETVEIRDAAEEFNEAETVATLDSQSNLEIEDAVEGGLESEGEKFNKEEALASVASQPNLEVAAAVKGEPEPEAEKFIGAEIVASVDGQRSMEIEDTARGKTKPEAEEFDETVASVDIQPNVEIEDAVRRKLEPLVEKFIESEIATSVDGQSNLEIEDNVRGELEPEAQKFDEAEAFTSVDSRPNLEIEDAVGGDPQQKVEKFIELEVVTSVNGASNLKIETVNGEPEPEVEKFNEAEAVASVNSPPNLEIQDGAPESQVEKFIEAKASAVVDSQPNLDMEEAEPEPEGKKYNEAETVASADSLPNLDNEAAGSGEPEAEVEKFNNAESVDSVYSKPNLEMEDAELHPEVQKIIDPKTVASVDSQSISEIEDAVRAQPEPELEKFNEAETVASIQPIEDIIREEVKSDMQSYAEIKEEEIASEPHSVLPVTVTNSEVEDKAVGIEAAKRGYKDPEPDEPHLAGIDNGPQLIEEEPKVHQQESVIVEPSSDEGTTTTLGISSTAAPNDCDKHGNTNSAVVVNGDNTVLKLIDSLKNGEISSELKNASKIVGELNSIEASLSGRLEGRQDTILADERKVATILADESIQTWPENNKEMDAKALSVDVPLPTSSLTQEKEFPTNVGVIVKENGSTDDNSEVSLGPLDNHSVIDDHQGKTQSLEVFHNETSQATKLPVTIPNQNERALVLATDEQTTRKSVFVEGPIARRSKWSGCCGLLDLLFSKDK